MSKNLSHELIRQYEQWVSSRLAPKSVNIYVIHVRRFLEFCDDHEKDVNRLQASDIVEFAETLRDYKPATQDSIRHALESLFDFLVDDGQRPDSPIDRSQFATRSRTKLDRRRPRPRQISQKIARLGPLHRSIALVVSELLEKGASLQEIFGIAEASPTSHWIEVKRGRDEPRPIPISGYVRARLDEWGGKIPIGLRAFQRAVGKVGLYAKDLGDPSRPGLADFHLTLLPDESVHDELERRSRPAFLRGEYDTAVFEAMKAVEISVRRASGLSADDIGTGLIRKAFEVDRGHLRDPAVVKAERQATSDLFAGAIGLFKNPGSHRDLNMDDPIEVAGILRLADVLLRIVDRASQKVDEF